jgi:hypothetical protein
MSIEEERTTNPSRRPDKNTETTPISDLIANGEPERLIRKKIVYDMRPLAMIIGLIGFIVLAWAFTFTIDQINDGATARACVKAGGSWVINDKGVSECRQ